MPDIMIMVRLVVCFRSGNQLLRRRFGTSIMELRLLSRPGSFYYRQFQNGGYSVAALCVFLCFVLFAFLSLCLVNSV